MLTEFENCLLEQVVLMQSNVSIGIKIKKQNTWLTKPAVKKKLKS